MVKESEREREGQKKVVLDVEWDISLRSTGRSITFKGVMKVERKFIMRWYEPQRKKRMKVLFKIGKSVLDSERVEGTQGLRLSKIGNWIIARTNIPDRIWLFVICLWPFRETHCEKAKMNGWIGWLKVCGFVWLLWPGKVDVRLIEMSSSGPELN